MDPTLVTRAILFVSMTASAVALWWAARAAASGRLKRNQMAGIRVAATFASEEAWLAAHQRAERYSVWSAVIALAAGIVAILPVAMELAIVVVLLACIVILAVTLFGARVGIQAAKEAEAKRQQQSGND